MNFEPGRRGIVEAGRWWIPSVLRHARSIFETSAFPSYAIVVLVAAKTVWGMWLYRDLTSGDTSGYFILAVHWLEGFRDSFLWSPLYTAFYGEALRVTHSVYGATTLHRIVIVLAADVGVLALMRRLMSPGMALLIALWWTVLPINFDTLYEVHLFALLPMLVVLIVACGARRPLHRGIILALLLAITVLVRNETIVLLAVFAAFCAVEEIARPFDSAPATGRQWRRLAAAYLAPLAVAVALLVGAYAQSVVKYPQISAAAELKHTLNMCQVYAFGYSQRHPEYTASPWTGCGPLMKQTFGNELPALSEMLRTNPGATLRHFAWNASLAVNGMQVALFNAMSGTVNPDYAPVLGGQNWAAVLSALCAALLLAGAWRLRVEWPALRPALIERRHFITLLVGLALVVCVVVLTQRPRPSYLFAFTVCIMALVGMSADLMTRQGKRTTEAIAMLAAVVLVLVLPFYQIRHASPRPLYVNLSRLQPYQALLAAEDGKLLIGDYAGELGSYLRYRADVGGGSLVPHEFSVDDYTALSAWDRQQPLETFLAARGFAALFVQPRVMADLAASPAAKALLAGETQYRRVNSALDRDWGLYAVIPPGFPLDCRAISAICGAERLR